MDELGPDEQKFLDAMRIADEPRDTDRARVRATVLAGIGAGAAVTTTATAAAATKAGMAIAPWKIVVAVASVIVVGAGASAVVSRTPAAPIAPVASVAVASTSSVAVERAEAPAAPIEAASTESPAPPPPAVSERVAGPARPTQTSPRAWAPAVPGDNVDAELALLTQAQQALKRGDPNAALQALGRHAKEHPRGAMSVEREGLRAVASCEAKRTDGRALADRFIVTNPGSPLVARIRTACAIDPATKP